MPDQPTPTSGAPQPAVGPFAQLDLPADGAAVLDIGYNDPLHAIVTQLPTQVPVAKFSASFFPESSSCGIEDGGTARATGRRVHVRICSAARLMWLTPVAGETSCEGEPAGDIATTLVDLDGASFSQKPAAGRKAAAATADGFDDRVTSGLSIAPPDESRACRGRPHTARCGCLVATIFQASAPASLRPVLFGEDSHGQQSSMSSTAKAVLIACREWGLLLRQLACDPSTIASPVTASVTASACGSVAASPCGSVTASACRSRSNALASLEQAASESSQASSRGRGRYGRGGTKANGTVRLVIRKHDLPTFVAILSASGVLYPFEYVFDAVDRPRWMPSDTVRIDPELGEVYKPRLCVGQNCDDPVLANTVAMTRPAAEVTSLTPIITSLGSLPHHPNVRRFFGAYSAPPHVRQWILLWGEVSAFEMLHTRLMEGARVTTKTVAVVGYGVARGLAHLHHAGVCHNSVAPAAVLLRGRHRAMQASGSNGSTQGGDSSLNLGGVAGDEGGTGARVVLAGLEYFTPASAAQLPTVGRPGYAAPELFGEKKNAGRAQPLPTEYTLAQSQHAPSDIFALGMTLCGLCRGCLALECEDTRDLMTANLDLRMMEGVGGATYSPRSIVRLCRVPAQFVDILLRMIDLRPELRPLGRFCVEEFERHQQTANRPVAHRSGGCCGSGRADPNFDVAGHVRPVKYFV